MSSDNGAGSFLYPLTQFYAFAGEPIPHAKRIRHDLMPQPYRSLLVHDRAMTTTLEEFSGWTIHLRVLYVRLTREALYRKVLLVGDEREGPLEFGAIRINLSRFEQAVRRQIVEGRVPLGAILRRHHIPHVSRPRTFFAIDEEKRICQALGLADTPRLYGRKNVIRSDSDEVLAEVVEVLPPFGKGPRSTLKKLDFR